MIPAAVGHNSITCYSSPVYHGKGGLSGISTNSNRNDHEEPTDSNLNKKKRPLEESDNVPLIPDSSVLEIAKVNYRDFFVSIFTDNAQNPSKFFFEPLALLDPKSISSDSGQMDFSIQMWDQELRSKVLARLRSLSFLKNLEIQEDDVYVMPYEEIELNFNPDCILKAFKVSGRRASYHRLNESLDFYLECDMHPSVAKAVAEDFRANPKFMLKKCEMALECRSKKIQIISSFNISVLNSPSKDGEMLNSILPRLAEYDEQIKELRSVKMSNNVIPVFSVQQCINPDALRNQSFGYCVYDFPTKLKHGDFNLKMGIFTAKTAGIYQLHSSSHVSLFGTNSLANHQIDLKVDGTTKAVSFTQLSSTSVTTGYHPIDLLALLPLKPGQKVGVFLVDGQLHENLKVSTRFSGILFANQL